MRDFQIEEESRATHEVRFRVQVPVDLSFFEGHFPGDPIVPGVAQVHLAESCAAIAFPELTVIRGVRRLKFTEAMRPGDELAVHLKRANSDVSFVMEKQGRTASIGTLEFA